MKRSAFYFTALLCLGLVVFAPTVSAQYRLVRELRRMVGYQIVSVTTLRSISPFGDIERRIVLADGAVFTGATLTLALPMSDVIVFAKPTGQPRLNIFKLLLDDEFVDATLVR
jgi:hypothetical protein